MTHVAILSQTAFFAETPADVLSAISAQAQIRTLQRGDVLFNEGDIPDALFVVLSGRIAIAIGNKPLDSRESMLALMETGDLFGELELENDINSNEYAKALTDEVAICSFLMSDFEDLLLRNPSLALSYTKFVGLKMKRLKNNYANLISKDAKTRLLTFLKDWAERDGKQVGSRVVIENYLTQNDIAQIICTSRQTATLLLNELEENGLMHYGRKEIIIEDVTRLK